MIDTINQNIFVDIEIKILYNKKIIIIVIDLFFTVRKEVFMLKYSRQRESIKKCMMERCDHPTAETVYLSIKEEFPNISLATVYRNLSLLAETGEIVKISTGNGPDRFDANTVEHYHFFCRKCGKIEDLDMASIHHINIVAGENFKGKIEDSVTHFYGKCEKCLA